MIFDLAIIGAGIAGVSCAVYAKRAGLNFIMFEKNAVGGQILFINRIDNYIGLESIDGISFVEKLSNTLKNLNIEPISQEVIGINKERDCIKIFTKENTYISKTLVIATGASFKRLMLEGEEKFIGKGISYCAVCDGYFFKNKIVAVVGGGNTAVEEALYLSSISKKVILIHRKDTLKAMDYLKDMLFKKNNIEIKYNTVVKKLIGKDFLENIVLENLKEKKEYNLKINGLFIAIGMSPNTFIFKDIVNLDEYGFIITDEYMKTSCDFIWAVGDCRKRQLRQLITSASEGAISAISVYKYLRGDYISI